MAAARFEATIFCPVETYEHLKSIRTGRGSFIRIRKSLPRRKRSKPGETVRFRFKGQLQSGNIRRIINTVGRMLNGRWNFWRNAKLARPPP